MRRDRAKPQDWTLQECGWHSRQRDDSERETDTREILTSLFWLDVLKMAHNAWKVVHRAVSEAECLRLRQSRKCQQSSDVHQRHLKRAANFGPRPLLVQQNFSIFDQEECLRPILHITAGEFGMSTVRKRANDDQQPIFLVDISGRMIAGTL